MLNIHWMSISVIIIITVLLTILVMIWIGEDREGYYKEKYDLCYDREIPLRIKIDKQNHYIDDLKCYLHYYAEDVYYYYERYIYYFEVYKECSELINKVAEKYERCLARDL